MNTINLLPWRETARLQFKHKLLIQWLLCTVTALLLLWSGHLFIHHHIRLQQQKLLQIKTHNQGLLSWAQQAQALYTFQQQIIYFNKINTNNITLLTALSKITPQNLYFTALQQTALQIQLSGNAAQISDITVLTQRLKALPLLQNVTLQEIQSSQDNGKKFVLTMQLH